jgi:hypothetical protein
MRGLLGNPAAAGVVLALVLAGCPEPELTDPNSAQAATACRDAMRAELDDPSVELPDPNEPRIDGDLVIGTYLVGGSEVVTECRFTFDRETQGYEVLDTGLPAEPEAGLRDGEDLHPNDIADCLLDGGVGAGVSLDGAALELHDAMAQVIVEQGDAEVMVYGDADAAAAAEDLYRASFGSSSEVGRVRNVLYQADPDLDPAARSALGACLGI